MSPNPVRFIEHLRQCGYNPRSNKHSNVLAECIVSDLLAASAALRARALVGRVVYELNFDLMAGTSEWNVDLVLGAPPHGTPAPAPGGSIVRCAPSTVEIAIEIKSVMTEHRKAIKNRKRDFEAHHDHVHRYSGRAIAGGVLVVNASRRFKSPLRDEVTEHGDPAALVAHCVNQMRAVAVRAVPDAMGLDAKAVLVVSVDNANVAPAQYAVGRFVPRVGDPLQYDAFVQRVLSLHGERFTA